MDYSAIFVKSVEEAFIQKEGQGTIKILFGRIMLKASKLKSK